MFTFGLIGVFLNLFFFAQGGYLPVLYFQLSSTLLIGISFALSGYLLKKYHPKYIYIVGEVLLIVMLLALLLPTGRFSNVILFGMIYGISLGVLYQGNNLLYYDIPKKWERISFVAINNFIGGAVSLVAPIIAGFLIEYSNLIGQLRFTWDFLLAALTTFISAVVILQIKHVTYKKLNFSIKDTIIKGNKEYTKFKLYNVFEQFFSTPFTIILPIYVFEVTNSYIISGIFATYIIFLSMATNYIFREGFNTKGKFVNIAIPAIVMSSLVLIFPNVISPPVNVFVFATVYTIFSTPLDNVVSVEFMNFLDKNKNIDRALFWTNREYYLLVGRVAGIAVIFALLALFANNPSNFIIIFPALSLYSIVYFKIIKKKDFSPVFFVRDLFSPDESLND